MSQYQEKDQSRQEGTLRTHQMTEEEYRMDILEQEKLEERARKFVDLNQSQMD